MRDASHYHKRSRILKRIGFKSYAEYLKSALWNQIRTKVFLSKGTHCYLCIHRPATTIHHCRYSRADLLGKRMIGMFPLCNICHHEIEFKIDGSKCSVPEMRRLFNKKKKGRHKRLEKSKAKELEVKFPVDETKRVE